MPEPNISNLLHAQAVMTKPSLPPPSLTIFALLSSIVIFPRTYPPRDSTFPLALSVTPTPRLLETCQFFLGFPDLGVKGALIRLKDRPSLHPGI